MIVKCFLFVGYPYPTPTQQPAPTEKAEPQVFLIYDDEDYSMVSRLDPFHKLGVRD
jgi:hypothetical protein